jgi:hypothetical protein
MVGGLLWFVVRGSIPNIESRWSLVGTSIARLAFRPITALPYDKGRYDHNSVAIHNSQIG